MERKEVGGEMQRNESGREESRDGERDGNKRERERR